MHLRAAVLVCVATALLTEALAFPHRCGYDMIMQRERELYTARVPIVNGKCQFNGTEIPLRQPFQLENPCEEWSCDVWPWTEGTEKPGEVLFKRCDRLAFVVPKGCSLLRGTAGRYPDCCGKVVCE